MLYVCEACAAAYVGPRQRLIMDIVAQLQMLQVELELEAEKDPIMHRNACGVTEAIRIVEGFR